jgi:hypothetical protein
MAGGKRSGNRQTTRRGTLTSDARQVDLATYKIGAHPLGVAFPENVTD